MTRNDVEFFSDGQRCSAWHFPAQIDVLAGPAGRPVIVMGPGPGASMDAGLQSLAERFSSAGLDVLVFDYRGFGGSEGEPRQTVSVGRQMHDYRSALTAAAGLPGVDPERLVLWGMSLSGSHAIRAAADRDDVAAVVATVPLANGFAACRAALAQRPLTVLRWIITEPASRTGVAVEVARVRTAGSAKRLHARLLVQIADFDRYVPAHSIAKTASKGNGEVRHYPCDHFDAWPGGQWFDKIATDQVAFLTRVLAQPRLTKTG